MAKLTQMDRGATMFIAGETDSLYQHVCLLVTLDKRSNPTIDFDHFRQHCEERISRIPQFHWKLHKVPMGLDRPYWIEDEHFSFDHHIKRVALPSPGDHDTLCELAANLYCNHLDHTKPLWEIWFIEGLEGGNCAYLQKFHHCMMDGAGALKLIEFICDGEPLPSEQKEPEDSVSRARAGAAPSYSEQSARAWQHIARLPFETARSAYDFVRPRLLEQLEWPRKPQDERPEVPSTSFNGKISSERGAGLTTLSLDDIKQVKNHFQVTLNDVVLALVSGAIKRYLQEHSDLPELSLRTSMPVSLRSESDAQMSNKVTTATVTLATDLDDPVARLQAIHSDSEQAKLKAHDKKAGMVELFQIMPPLFVSVMMDTLPADQAPQIMGANLFVSNLMGPSKPLFVAGAEIQSMYPLSIVTAGMGINITCISYNKEMSFGIIVDSDQVAGYADIATGLETTLSEYLALCKPRRTRAKKKKVKPASTRSGARKPKKKSS